MDIVNGVIDTGMTPHGNSRAQSAVKCPQLYAWTFLRGVEVIGDDNEILSADGEPMNPAPVDGPQPAEPLIRGSIGHAFLAHHYARMRGDPVMSPNEALEERFAFYEQKWPNSTDNIRHVLRKVCNAYGAYYSNDFERFDVLEVEEYKAYTISDTGIDGTVRSAPFTVRRDLVVRSKANGLVYLWDHKTTRRLETKVKKRYTLTGQFLSLQYLGKLEYGDQFGGVFYNILGLEPVDFAREPIDPAPFRLVRWPRDYLYSKRLIDVLTKTYGERAIDWPGADNEMTCWSAYGKCPHFETCRFGPDTQR